MLCTADGVEGQERAVARSSASGATLHASATILPSLDAASYAVLLRDLGRSPGGALARRTSLVGSAAPPTDGATSPATSSDPPVSRTFERFALDGREALRHTIAVLY